jgi:hypothetical protein
MQFCKRQPRPCAEFRHSDRMTWMGEQRGIRCAWCSRPVEQAGRGRPRRFCRQSCRQRDYEARHRAQELQLGIDEIVVTRRELSELDDLIYVLRCALEDVEHDLAASSRAADVREALDWLLDAVRPVTAWDRSGVT